jgi:hypothetical protein
MTPEEANLIKELFNRLYTLENAARDREAEALIQDGLQYAPHAPYALVQTVLVQDEALKRANARIQELEAGAGGGDAPPRDTSFLGGVRDSLLGRRDSRGSVPSVSPGAGSVSPGAGDAGMSQAWQQTGNPAMPAGGPPGPYSAPPGMPAAGTGGGSFLGTAAAAAAGTIGGSLLLNTIRSMMGGGAHGSAHAAFDPSAGGGSPSTGGSAAGGELSRQAGLDDVGRSPASFSHDPGGDGYVGEDDDHDDYGDGDDDFDGGDGSGFSDE